MASSPGTGLCVNCGDPLIGFERATAKYCGEECGAAYKRWQKEPTPDLRKPKVCRCNGSHIAGLSEDGEPTCQKCGAPMEAGQRGAPLRLDFFSQLMEVPLYALARRGAMEWPDAGDREHSTDVRVYRGEPFRPDTEVEVRPASAFTGPPKKARAV